MGRILAASVAALLWASGASAQADLAAQFGARENIESIALSPDGTRVSFISPIAGQGSELYTADVTGKTPAVRVIALDGDPERLRWCAWVSSGRLVCSIHIISDAPGVLAGFSRLIAIDADGKNLKLVSARTSSRGMSLNQSGGSVIDWLPDEDGAVLMSRNYIPEDSRGTRIANDLEGFGVERIDTRTLATNRTEPPRRDAVDFISDGHGRIRIMGLQPPQGAVGYSGNTIKYLYRTKGASEWKDLSRLNVVTGHGFDPQAVDRDLDVAYGFGDKDGHRALFRVGLGNNLSEALVYSHPQVDVDGLIRIGRRHRVVGLSYATDKRRTEFFDPELKALAKALSKALPGLPLVSFVDASMDESRLLLWAGSDVDPGRYYLFDKTSKNLNEVLLARPQLEGVALSEVKPVTYKAADGTMIPGYLTIPKGSSGKGLPAIVMPHGGPGARDEWGFDWLSQYFAARGYAVLQPNFRGSSGYGDAWFQKNGFQSWQSAIGDVADGARWLAAQGIADPARMAIVGWSYGGYAALQAAATEPGLFKAVIAIAPVTDLEALRNDARDYMNFRNVDAFIGNGPHVKAGSPAQNAARITAPVLMFHGDRDLNVNVSQSRFMAEKLRAAGRAPELVLYPKLDHSLEDSKARTEMLGKSDAFLRKAMGM